MNRKILFAVCIIAGLPMSARAEQSFWGEGSPQTAPVAAPDTSNWGGISDQDVSVRKGRAIVDERPMWNALAGHDWAKFDSLASAARRRDKSWVMPEQMKSLRASGEAGEAIRTAAKQSRWQGVIDLAARSPDQFNCGQIGNLWHLAEANLATGNRDAARLIFRNAAVQCKSDDRFAAIQKSRAAFGSAEALHLLDLPGQVHPGEAALRQDYTKASRPQTAKAAPDTAFGDRTRELGRLAASGAQPDFDVAAFGQDVLSRRNGGAAEVLGWWYLKRSDYAQAETWFQNAASWGKAQSGHRGLALTYSAAGRQDDLKALLQRFPAAAKDLGAGGDPLVASLFALKNKGELAECLRRASDPALAARADVQFARGWCLLDAKFGQSEAAQAVQVFERAGSLPGLSADQIAESRKGRKLAAEKAGMDAYLQDMALEGWMVPGDRAAIRLSAQRSAFNSGLAEKDYRKAAVAASALIQSGEVKDDKEMMLMGWVFHNSGNCHEAWRIFNRLYRSGEASLQDEAGRALAAVNGTISSENGCRMR